MLTAYLIPATLCLMATTITLTRGQVTSCGGELNGEHGAIDYPGGDGPYDDNENCHWTISTTPGKTINLRITNFDVEYSTNCSSYDWLRVYNGPTNSSELTLANYCNRSLPEDNHVSSSGNVMHLWFHTDSSVTYGGFELTWDSGPYCLDEDFALFEHTGTCLKVIDNKRLDWSKAQEHCESSTSNLVQIRDKETNNHIKDMLTRGNRYWTGMKQYNGVFSYSDGEPLGAFQPWASGEPNNHKNKEDCVEMIANGRGAWNDKRCGKKRRFICESTNLGGVWTNLRNA